MPKYYDKDVTGAQAAQLKELIDRAMQKGRARGITGEFLTLSGSNGLLKSSSRQHDSTLSWHLVGQPEMAIHLRPSRGAYVCSLSTVPVTTQLMSELERLIDRMEVLPWDGTLFGYRQNGKVVTLFDVHAHPLKCEEAYASRVKMGYDYRVYQAEGTKLPDVFRTNDRAQAARQIWSAYRSKNVLTLGARIKQDTPGSIMVYGDKRVHIELDWGVPFMGVPYVRWDPGTNRPEVYRSSAYQEKLSHSHWHHSG